MNVLDMFRTVSVRVVNVRSNVILSDVGNLTVSDAIEQAERMAHRLADGYGDHAKAEAREFPFVAAADAAYDDFSVEVWDRPTDRKYPEWVGVFEVSDGFVGVHGTRLRRELGCTV